MKHFPQFKKSLNKKELLLKVINRNSKARATYKILRLMRLTETILKMILQMLVKILPSKNLEILPLLMVEKT